MSTPSTLVQNRIISDAELITRLQYGDEWTFQLLIRRFGERIFAVALGVTLDKETSQTILQETLFSAYRSIRMIDKDASLSVWLFQFAMSGRLDKRRSQNHRPGLSDTAAPQQIRSVLRQLLPEDRAIFSLKAVERLSDEEIARILGFPVKTIKSRQITLWERMVRILDPAAWSDPAASENGCGVKQLIHYLDGRLEPAERADMAAHMKACEACRRQFDVIEHFTEDFGQWIDRETRAVDFKSIEKTVIIQALRHHSHHSRVLRKYGFKALILVIIAGILTAGVFFLNP